MLLFLLMVCGYRFFLFMAAIVLTSGPLSSHFICVSVLLQFHCLFLPCCSSSPAPAPSPSSSNKIKSTISAISPPHTLRRAGQLFFHYHQLNSAEVYCILFYLPLIYCNDNRSVAAVFDRWKKSGERKRRQSALQRQKTYRQEQSRSIGVVVLI